MRSLLGARTDLMIGLAGLVLWVLAYSWYFYGHRKAARKAEQFMIWLGLKQAPPKKVRAKPAATPQTSRPSPP